MKIETDIRRVAIIGLGLVGGSFALALKEASPGIAIVGWDQDAQALQEAQARGLVNDAARGYADAASGADLVLIATPLATLPEVLGGIAPALQSTTLISDVCSTKQHVVRNARDALGPAFARFVPCHPIAGSEQSGAGAARADLFLGKPVIATPLPDTAEEALAKVLAIWETLGAVSHRMTPGAHDELFAFLSHAPHLLAYAWMDLATSRASLSEGLALAGSGFRDFTRIAASDATLWTDIVFDNRAAIEPLLRAHVDTINTLRRALADGERDMVATLMARAARLRRALP